MPVDPWNQARPETAEQCARRNGPSAHLSAALIRGALQSDAVPLATTVSRLVALDASAGLRGTSGALGHVGQAAVWAEDRLRVGFVGLFV
jgi:hypothetical protein